MELNHRNQPAPSVVTPGNHDGVHLGHRALVDAARALADRQSPRLRVVALTFDPHPIQVLAPERAPSLLTSPARRIELLRAAGADEVVVRPFDRAFASLSPEAFVQQVLVQDLGAKAVVVGPDFRFGARRAGDLAMLQSLLEAQVGPEAEVLSVPPVMLDGQVVSSSAVRSALAQGDVELAARMLTRVHDITREVIQGKRLGRTIDFPTANLALEGVMTPADGVYAVVARVVDGADSGPLLQGVANLGVRPTVQGGRSLEVHLLDFSGDLYGKQLRVGFVARLRSEQKFAGLAELRAQLVRDVEAGRAALARTPQALWAWI